MINNTDSIYSQLVPLEYPKVGEKPSSCKVGVVTLSTVALSEWRRRRTERQNEGIKATK